MSPHEQRSAIERIVQQHMTMNTVASLQELTEQVNSQFGFDESPQTQNALQDILNDVIADNHDNNQMDYDDVVQQSFPASDPPPPLSD